MTENRQSPETNAASIRTMALVVLLAAAAATFFHLTNFRLLTNPDAMKYAQMSRDILRGEGAMIEMLHPSDFAFARDGVVADRYGMIGRFRQILSPLAVAGAFAVFGVRDGVAALATAMLYVLSVLLFYLLARRLFGEAEAALAAVLFALHGKVLTYAVSGMTEPLYLLLIVSALLMMLRAGERWWWALPAGLALAALLFTKDLAKVFVAMAVLGAPLLIARRRAATFLVLAVGLAAGYVALDRLERLINYDLQNRDVARVEIDWELVAAHAPRENAWTTRLIGKFGKDVILQFSDLFPGHTRERSLTPVNEARVFEANKKIFFAKWKTNAVVTLKNMFAEVFNPLAFLLFLLFPWVRRTDEAQPRRVYLWTIGLLGAYLFVCLFLFSMARYLLVVTPLVLLFAAATAQRLAQRWCGERRWLRRATLVVVALLMLAPYALTAGSDALAKVTDKEARQVRQIDAEGVLALGRFLQEQTQRDDVVVCDVPWLTIWRGDRTTIWLPVDIEHLTTLRRRGRVDWLLLTFQYPWNMRPWREWLAAFVQAGEPVRDGFRFVTAYRTGPHTFYLFQAVNDP